MPANYDLPENGVVKRVRYFDGLFLKDQDFIDDQKYHTDRQRRPNLLLRVAGICDGLTVLVESNQVKVTSGSALDNHGRLIVLSETLSVDLKGQAGELDIYISYQEEASDITQANNDKSSAGAAAANSKGAKGATRWWENPRIEAVLKTAKPTAEDTIWLGRVTVSGTTVQGNPNLQFRQYSGVYLPSSASSKNGPSLRSGGNVNPTLAVLTGDLSVTGNVGIGTDKPGQTLTVKGILNSGKYEGSGMANGGNLAIVSNAPQIDFIDTEHNDWSIHVNSNKMYFIRQPWEFKDLVLDGAGNVGIGTDTPGAKLSINGGLHVGGDSDPGDNNLLVDGNSTISGALSVISTSTFTGNVGIGATSPQRLLEVGTNPAGTGTVVSSGTTITGTNTQFQTQLRQGDSITATYSATINGKTQTVTRTRYVNVIASNTSLTTNSAFDPSIPQGTAFTFSRSVLQINGNARLGGTANYDTNTVLSVAPGTIQFDAPGVAGGRLTVDGITGNVGIGTDKPGAKLDINASDTTVGGWYEAIRFSQSAHSAITHPGGGLLFGLHSDRNFYFADIKDGVFQKYVMQIEADTGNVGIGTTEPGSYKLNVQGNQYINSNLTIGGKIQSGMWRVTHVFDRKAGPLPITADFTTGGGTLVVLFTGTAFRANAGFVNLVMSIDNQDSMWIDLYTNEGNSHKTLPLQFRILSGISAGNHTLKIDKYGTSTVSDANDRFYAMVLELPF
jgi:hypothetical protein